MVSIVDSLLSTRHALANRILRCAANAYFIGSGWAAALVSRVSRGFAAQKERHFTPFCPSLLRFTGV